MKPLIYKTDPLRESKAIEANCKWTSNNNHDATYVNLNQYIYSYSVDKFYLDQLYSYLGSITIIIIMLNQVHT